MRVMKYYAFVCSFSSSPETVGECLACSYKHTQCSQTQHLLNKRPIQQGNIWKHLSSYNRAGGEKTRSLMRTVCPFSTSIIGLFASQGGSFSSHTLCRTALILFKHDSSYTNIYELSAKTGCWLCVSLRTCMGCWEHRGGGGRAEPLGLQSNELITQLCARARRGLLPACSTAGRRGPCAGSRDCREQLPSGRRVKPMGLRHRRLSLGTF